MIRVPTVSISGFRTLFWRCSTILIGIIIADILRRHASDSFVKQMLIKPPVLEVQELWRRSPLNSANYGNFTLMLTRTLEVPTPSYVQILKQGSLSITSFSLLRKGSVRQFDLNGVRRPKTWEGDYLWPNELSEYRHKTGSRVMLVADGFLMPGQDDGGIYAIRDPDAPTAKSVRITKNKKGWFYHRAMHVVLPGGTEGILTARAQKSVLGPGTGELVWLDIPPEFQSQSESQSPTSMFRRSSSNSSGTSDSTTAAKVVAPSTSPSSAWDETILATGPDVMFELLDLDETDDRVEIVAAHFFGKKLSIHSIRAVAGGGYPHVEVVEESHVRTPGRPYGLCLATFSENDDSNSANENVNVNDNHNGNNDNGDYGTPSQMVSKSGPAGAYSGGSSRSERAASRGAERNTGPDSRAAKRRANSLSSGRDYNYRAKRHTFEYSEDSWLSYSLERKYQWINRINKSKYKSRLEIAKRRLRKLGQVDNKASCDNVAPTHLLVTSHECSYDIPSAVKMAKGAIGGNYPIVKSAPQWLSAEQGSGDFITPLSAGAPAVAATVTSSARLNRDSPRASRRAPLSAGAPAVAATVTSSARLNRDSPRTSRRAPLSAGAPAVAATVTSSARLNRDSPRTSRSSRGHISKPTGSYASPDSPPEPLLLQAPQMGPYSGNLVGWEPSELPEALIFDQGSEGGADLVGGALFAFRIPSSKQIRAMKRQPETAVTTASPLLVQTSKDIAQQQPRPKGNNLVGHIECSPTSTGANTNSNSTNSNSTNSNSINSITSINGSTSINFTTTCDGTAVPNLAAPSTSSSNTTSTAAKSTDTSAISTTACISALPSHPSSFMHVANWQRTTLCSGFRVRGWGGIFAPGAPGFPYVFHMPNRPQSPPLILLAGDCTGSAYLFAPVELSISASISAPPSSPRATLSPVSTSASDGDKMDRLDIASDDTAGGNRDIPEYELIFEIECGATVGSAAVSSTNDGTGDVNLYIPAYELNKVHVFRLSEREVYRKNL